LYISTFRKLNEQQVVSQATRLYTRATHTPGQSCGCH